MATAKHQSKSRPGRSNSLQRMLELEKQSMLDRRNAAPPADPATHPSPYIHPDSGSASPANTTPTSPASPQSHPIVSSKPPQARPTHARPTIPRRQLPTGASLATRDPNRQTPKPPGDGDPDALQHHQRQPKTQLPYELPPINTGTSTKSLAAELFGASPASSSSDRSTGNHLREVQAGDTEGPGMSAAVSTPTRTIADDQMVAAQTAPDQPDSGLEDRRSVCQSPSWEAYGRRKKEKKEKELADKEAKAKKRRLSKVPPSASPQTSSMSTSAPHKQSPLSGKAAPGPPQSRKGLTQSQTDACMSDLALPRPRQHKERPNSVLGLSSPDLSLPGDIPTPHSPRGRSSSFTSLFKAPFEVRRPSADQSSESGFIGGIKLEQHRLAAHQQAFNEQTICTDSDIHPAFRKTEKRSSSPLRFLTPRPEPKDAQSRAYPPIAIRTSGKNQALLAPEPTTMHEGGVMSKWRSRVGLKSSAHKEQEGKAGGSKEVTGPKLTKTPFAQRDESLSRIKAPRNHSTPVISVPIAVQKVDEPIDDEKRCLHSVSDVDHSAHPALVDRPREDMEPTESTPHTLENMEDPAHSGSETNSQPSYKTAPSSPPPPPRRSSKRKSLVAISDSSVTSSPSTSQLDPEPQRNGDDNGNKESGLTRPTVKVSSPKSPPVGAQQRARAATGPTSPSAKPNRWSMSNPPSIPYDTLTPSLDNGTATKPKRNFKEAAKAAFGRGGPSAASNNAASSSRSRSPYDRGQGVDGEGRSISTNNIPAGIGPSSKPARVLGMQDWKISHPMPVSPPTHSSEDSCSDDYRSVSGHGTPDTSRPQSETGAFPNYGDHGNEEKHGRHHSGYTSVLPSPAFSYADDAHHTNQPSPFELDPIQSAALKVMAAFPDVPVRRPDPDRRSNSETNLAANATVTLRTQQHRERSKPRRISTTIESGDIDLESKSPPLRDLIMSKDESSVAAPWPATYLEAARKAAPAALAPRTVKSQSSASPVMTSPKQLSPLSLDQHSSSTSDLAVKASGHQPSASVNSNLAGDHIAKMFVECCGCRYYHDMPSKLYEAMVNPECAMTLGENIEFAGSVSMTVKCPWCKHEMSTKCCAGLAAMVYVKERLH